MKLESEEEQNKKGRIKKWKLVAVFSFLMAVLLAGFVVGTWWMEKKTEEEYKSMQEENAKQRQKVPEKEKEKEKPDIPVDFPALQKMNPDIYAWITIPDTVIDYPVVQDQSDNSYYLDHSAEKTESVSGAIYSENYNNTDFSDHIILLYGCKGNGPRGTETPCK